MPISDVTPIELIFYTDEDEVEQVYKRSRIPSYLLDMAISLQDGLSDDSGAQQNIDALFDFIVEFYGNKFSRDELKQKTDLLECMAVLQSVIARASGLMQQFAQANPTLPSRRKK